MTGHELTAAQRDLLLVVRERGNIEDRFDPSLRRGVSATGVVVALRGTGSEVVGSGRKRAVVNRLLALRRRGLVTDVDGRWFTTDDGERVAL